MGGVVERHMTVMCVFWFCQGCVVLVAMFVRIQRSVNIIFIESGCQDGEVVCPLSSGPLRR